jgi:DNA-binding HxlR family transcriptional regulator
MQVLFLKGFWYTPAMSKSLLKKVRENDCRSCCPISSALDILGDRWTLLVVRDMLMFGKHEFSEFVTGPEGIATNILTDRLKRLLCMDVIAFLPHPKHKSKKLYYLTEKGKDLLPLILEMALWGGTHNPAPDLPKDQFGRLKRNPKKMMEEIRRELNAWESQNLKREFHASKK